MLKREDTHVLPSQAAAEVRVMPEELAAAITRLEARKAASQRSLDGTVTIGEVVQQLGIDATPEEVLAEVQAKRRAGPRIRLSSVWDRVSLTFGICGLLIGLTVAGNSFLQMHHPSSVHFASAGKNISILSDVPNEQQAFVDSHGLKQLIEGAPETKVEVYANGESTRWGIIKHDGKVYVHAYTFKTTEQGLRTNSTKLFSSEHPNDFPFYSGMVFDDRTFFADVKVTLPARALRYQDSQKVDGISKVLVKEVNPDNHIWDEF